MTFPDFARELGIIPPAIIEPGRWIRCATVDHPKSRNGAIKMASDGETGWAQDWSQHYEPVQWWREGDNKAKVDPEKLRARMDEATQERQRSEHDATGKAIEAWVACKPLRGMHPYLHRKRLSVEGCSYLRVDDHQRLIVPMYDGQGKMRSLQSIEANGTKKFWLGAPASGCRYTLARAGSTVTILCEGLSTGLTLYCAVPNATVIVAFSASNMVTVAGSRSWSGLVVVGGDNDADTEERIGRNPGVLAAMAASKVIGCGTAIPSAPGDWNDAYCAQLATIEEDGKNLAYLPSELASRKRALMGVRISVCRNSVFIAPK